MCQIHVCSTFHLQVNKAFKTDSQRLPFLVLIVGYSVYGGMVSFRWYRCSHLNWYLYALGN
ncbi:hypothetical protein FQP87_04250 [Vibrio tasmaniensis]|nr:hypothetical protein FQP87_04250 [Vibrio tasmaniensis]